VAELHRTANWTPQEMERTAGVQAEAAETLRRELRLRAVRTVSLPVEKGC
jgi:hypothetical protein